jgi:hypothetical protein
MAKTFDPYGEIYDEDDDYEFDLSKYREARKDSKRQAALRDTFNEIGIVEPISEEAMERRKHYETNLVDAHQEVFKQSTGIKPFGTIQIDSINRTHHVLKHGGRSVIAEPRGFGKTSRTANNALMAILHGTIRYALILASSVQKAEDILESIKTELIDNEELYKMYPAICECFRHVGDSPTRALRQTYLGEKTHIGFTKLKIRMPMIPGEPSSGSIIQVRSKDNVRGLNVKIRYGEESGRVLRPDFVFMDDIQTDEEANSPTSVWTIVQTIKKSILFSGTHSRPTSAVMCCTPICPGDVSTHFILNEPSWDCIVSPMVRQMPKNLDMWLNDYARMLLDFDRYSTGSRLEARLRARKYVEENYDALHEGAEVAWDWAYAWAEDPQTEISALQHAMNFKIEEGEEAFESECQCNVMPRIDEAAGVKATLDEIMNKVHSWPRMRCPVETKFITTHIDVNKNVLTYTTVASPKEFRPMVIDSGEWPEQRGATWRKQDIVYTLKKQYPDIPEQHERIYWGLRDLINQIGKKTYIREDNLVMHNNLIMVDMGFSIDEVQRAIRDSDYRQLTMCYRGQGIRARDKPFMDRHYEKHAEKHFHCATVPTTDRTLTVLYADVNYFKTAFHKGIKSRSDICGSLSLFTPERASGHLLLAKHCLVEIPEEDYFDKEDRRVITWSNPKDEDNEYFDNIVGCLAGLFKLGCEIRARKKKQGTYSIKEYIEKQKAGR